MSIAHAYGDDVDSYERTHPISEPGFCSRCGAKLVVGAYYCSQCARRVPREWIDDEYVSPRSRAVALILCAVLGYLGIHRFYVGKIFSGIVWLCTGGLFGIGYVIDIILIVAGGFRDIDGRYVLDWDWE